MRGLVSQQLTVPLVSCETNIRFSDSNNVLLSNAVFGLEDASWSGGGLKSSARFDFSSITYLGL